jgi:hypothetical protein
MTRRWTAVGIVASVVAFGALVVIGLTGEPPDPGTEPDLRNGRVFIQDNLWTAGQREYAVWVDHDGTPYAGWHRVGGAEWHTKDLSEIEGNPLAAPTAEDNHNIYVVGVDADGGVHVVGNMLVDPLRYVRNRDGDLANWSTAKAPATAETVTYPAFAALPGGTLLFFRRERGAVPWAGKVVLDRLSAKTDSWQSFGAILDGAPSEESAYLHHVAIDPASGMIHILFEWRSGEGPSTNSDVGYARSADGGRTWETSEGAPIPKPITHANAETVIDTVPEGSGLLNQGGMTVDSFGQPHGIVTFMRRGGEEVFEHVWLEGAIWHREVLDDLDLDGRPQLAGTSDGRVWLLGVRENEVVAIDITPNRERLADQEIAQVPLGWEVAYDSQALVTSGAVRMLIPRGNAPRVVEAELGG